MSEFTRAPGAGRADNAWRGREVASGTPPSSNLPPQNIEAEEAILGAMMVSQTAREIAVDVGLREADFYRPSHRAIFAAIQRIQDQDHVDELVVINELKRHNELDEVGGRVGVLSISERVPAAANARAYAEEVIRQSTLRRLVETGYDIARLGHESPDEPGMLIDTAGTMISDLSQQRDNSDFIRAADLLGEIYDEITERAESGGAPRGVPTGFTDFDAMTGGLQKDQLIILAARPAMGKTSFALNIAEHIAIREQRPIAVFSLEMSPQDLVVRMMCSVARVDQKRIRIGVPRETDWPLLVDAVGKLMQTRDRFYIDQSGGLTPMELRTKTRRLHHQLRDQGGLSMVIIDYLQLMEPGKKVDSHQVGIAYISRQLKMLAMELHIPVIALSQLSRASEARSDKRPMLSDLRDCVTGDTLVHLADGRRVPIADLVDTEPNVLAMRSDGVIVPARSDKVWTVGERDVFDVRLASGRSIRCTARHRLFTGDGWKRLEDIAAGERLAIAREVPEPAITVRWPDHEVALLGHLVGDGSYLSGQPLRYTTASDDNAQVVREAAEAMGCTVNRHEGRGNWHQLVLSGNGNRWHPAGVNLWLRKLGIFGQRSAEKRLPESVFQLPNDQIALLLRHLWATDGCIWVPKDGQRSSPRVFFATCSPRLAADVAALLTRLGIVARTTTTHQPSGSNMYSVRVSGRDAQLRFLRVVGAFGPRNEPATRLDDWHATRRSNTNIDTVPSGAFERVQSLMAKQGISARRMAVLRGRRHGGNVAFNYSPSRSIVAEYAEVLDDVPLYELAVSDLFWDAVVWIEPAGHEVVYDMTVPAHASWLADSVVCHNSGAIEQDADIVLFLHRPEYYERDKPELQGLAELIIAKHRNGEVGSVWMGFFSKYTQFVNLEKNRTPPPSAAAGQPLGAQSGGYGGGGGQSNGYGSGGGYSGPPPQGPSVT